MNVVREVAPLVVFLRGASGAATLRALPTSGPSRARAHYLAGLLDVPIRALVANAGSVTIEAASVGGELVPIVVNDGADEDCYLISPIGFYFRYTLEELAAMTPTRETELASLVIRGARPFVRLAGFNRVVFVNHWLLSTPSRVRLSDEALEALRAALVRRWPDHALVYRGILETEPEVLSAFERAGWERIVDRPVMVWWEGKRRESSRTRRHRLVDRRAKARLDVRHEVRDDEFDRVAYLYERLYRDKYSKMNPAFTGRFFHNLVRSGFATIAVVRRGGEAMGFGTWYVDLDGTLVFLNVGRETDVPVKELPIYLAFSAISFERALAENRPLFLSTGVEAFKRARGAVEILEYDATYTAHLPAWRRAPWTFARRCFDIAARELDLGEL